ncbi:MAG: 4Fe-4S dicluster domain-containing protein [Betaproteobacteria bacterium]
MTPQAPRRQYAHLWDASRCINCGACLLACSSTNAPQLAQIELKDKYRSLATNIRRIETEGPKGAQLLLSQCQQCSAAPCLKKCPGEAIFRDASGLVRTDEEKCIQCGECVDTCPYGARWMDPQADYPRACMGPGCNSLVAAGQMPACVQACPAMARSFGNAADSASEVARRIKAGKAQLLDAKLGTKPNFYVVPRSA